MKVKRICQNCGREFFIYPSKAKLGYGKYCSRECANLLNIGENNSRWKGGKIKCVCKTCGKEFFATHTTIKNGGGKYCSYKCKSISQENKVKRICPICEEEFFVVPSKIKKGYGKYCSNKCKGMSKKGENNPIWKGGRIKCICNECGNEYFAKPYEIKNGIRKYCSRKCKYESERGEKSPVWKGGETKRICEICGKEFFVITAKIKKGFGKYCSAECMGKASSVLRCGENSTCWKGGISFLPYCPKFNEHRKEAVRNFFDRKCLACGSDEIEFRKKLPVHHIDHDKEQGCDGKPFNLVPLCASCHSKELWDEEEYRKYINKTLEEGFKWGIWNREEYMKKVMYPDN